MNVVYLADTQIPSRATNGMQIMRMCAAFAAAGASVTLVHPYRFGNRPEGLQGDVHAFYGVPPAFGIVTLPTPLTLGLSNRKPLAAAARGIPMAAWLLARARPGARPFVTYSRSMLGALLSVRARTLWGRRSACRGVFVELHDRPASDRWWRLLTDVDGVVVISEALRSALGEVDASLGSSAVVAHDGVQSSLLLTEPSPDVDRRRRALDVPPGATVVGYTGRVNAGKGVDTLLEAAGLLASRPVHFLLVGKVYEEIEPALLTQSNVCSVGFVPPGEVARYVDLMDMLVMPTSGRLSYSAFTSPLKLFEYMASGKPIICSALPVLEEVVTDGVDAFLFRPDDPVDLARRIEHVLDDPSSARRLGSAAALRAREYTWERRADTILTALSRRLSETGR